MFTAYFLGTRNSMIQLAFPSPRNIKVHVELPVQKDNVSLDFLCLEMCCAWLFPHPGNPFVSTDQKLGKTPYETKSFLIISWEIWIKNYTIFHCVSFFEVAMKGGQMRG